MLNFIIVAKRSESPFVPAVIAAIGNGKVEPKLLGGELEKLGFDIDFNGDDDNGFECTISKVSPKTEQKLFTAQGFGSSEDEALLMAGYRGLL